MDATKSFVKVYGISPEEVEDFEFDFSVDSNDLLTELVPELSKWEDIGWMELDEYEYNPREQAMHFILETKWLPPVSWLEQMSKSSFCFQNKLITMATIRKDETLVTGVAVQDGEILQNKTIFKMSSQAVGKYYDDTFDQYELDDLDNQIWDSIGNFLNICKKFYLGGQDED